MNHLNEDMLIQYAFDLLDTQQQHEVAGHLQECDDCRDKLEQLRKQFSILDALSEEGTLSEGLIQKTVAIKAERRKSPDTSGGLRPRAFMLWFEWTVAAAAVILICALLLQSLPDTHVKEPVPGRLDKKTVAKLEERSDLQQEQLLKPAPVNEEPGPEVKDNYAASVGTLKDGIKVVDGDAIPEVAPFAPASAIELVVLPKPDAMQLTIYNSADLTLVRDTRKLTLKPGWNWLQFMWDGTLIDPTSLSLVPLEHADKIDIQQLVYPARLRDIGRWLIRSEVEGAVPFEITYFASGLSWRAFYMGTMNENETTMNLKGYVNVANHSGQDFENAQTRLVVGETHLIDQIQDLARRRYPYGPEIFEDEESKYYWYGLELKDEKERLLGEVPALGGALNFDYDAGDLLFSELSIKKIEKEGLSEYFLYTIEGTEDLPNTWAKRLPSFDVNNIPVKSRYKYDEDRYGSETIRFISFVNDTEHELGETPIPQGSVKIYRNVNAAQNLSYVGQSSVKYIPVNEDVEMNFGISQLVKAEPVLMDTKTDHYTFDKNNNIDGWDEIETWKLKLTNTRDIPVELEITRNFGTDYWDIDVSKVENIEYKKHDKSHARFTLTLPARTEISFGYTVTKYQGTRNEHYIKKIQEQQK